MSIQKIKPKPKPKLKLPTSQNDSQQQPENPHINSSLLPKIHKNTTLAKIRNNDHHLNNNNTKIMINEGDQIEKRIKMAGIISDYLDNFKMKQKASILAFSSQKNKLEHKPMKVEGISHSKFVGVEHLSQNQKGYSMDTRKRHRSKLNRSLVQKIRNDCKTYELKRRPRKFYTESEGTIETVKDLKGYVLKAKKSVIDCRQLSREKIFTNHKLSQVGPW